MSDAETKRAIAEDFVARAEAEVLPVLAGDTRFRGLDRLRRRYSAHAQRLKAECSTKAEDAFQAVHNELCAAAALLAEKDGVRIASLEYEPRHDNVDRHIDFEGQLSSGQRIAFEVKTICPDDKDATEHLEKIKARGLIPENIHVHLDGAFWHNRYASRASLLDVAIDFEARIRAIWDAGDDRPTCILCIFGGPFRMRRDWLEDFVGFYRRGRHQLGDPFMLMERHSMAERGTTLDRTIDHFTYVERPRTEQREITVCWSVREPALFHG